MSGSSGHDLTGLESQAHDVDHALRGTDVEPKLTP